MVLFRECCLERENSLSSVANSVSSAEKLGEFALAQNDRLRGTHRVVSLECGEGQKKLTELGV